MAEETNSDNEIIRLQMLADYDGEDRVVGVKNYLKETPEGQSGKVIRSGFRGLDKLIGGFHAGELIVVAGPTGQGKTTLCRTFTEEISRDGTPSLWFSFEMPGRELIKSFGGDVPAFFLPLKVKKAGLGWVRERIEEAIAKHSVWAVFIDHLHFLLSMGELAKAKSASILLGMVLRELKQIALETETVIFLISHLRKLHDDSRPTIDDLRDSSFTGQEADSVLLTWRLKEKIKEEPGYRFLDRNILSVEKARRTGRLGSVRLKFANGRFYEMDLRGDDEHA